MKVAHLMLFAFYIDNGYYQENILSIQNKNDGHDVLIIASTLILGQSNKVYFEIPKEYETKEKIKVIRVPYRKILSRKFSIKFRAYKQVYSNLEKFKPDVIFSHGIGGYEAVNIAKYIKNNPETKLFIDCHSDYFNSATNFFSKNILHRIIYRYFFWKYVKYAEKVYYVAPESIKFLRELYGFRDEKKLEYLPLGGYIKSNFEKIQLRNKIRKELQIPDDSIVFIHSGKLDSKKKSVELIKAFNSVNQKEIFLLIVGAFSDDVYDNVKEIISKDFRIKYIGWKVSEELQEYLCASDVYIQPGGRTVTVQNAACCGCVVITNPYLIYTELFGDAAMYIENEDDIKKIIEIIAREPSTLKKYQSKINSIAKKKLDYKIIASKYLNN